MLSYQGLYLLLRNFVRILRKICNLFELGLLNRSWHRYFRVSFARFNILLNTSSCWNGWVVQWCWVNFQCRGVLLIWLILGQGSTALAVGVGGGCLDIFTLNYLFSPLSPSLWETARYILKYCLKGPLNPKQPTNQSSCF